MIGSTRKASVPPSRASGDSDCSSSAACGRAGDSPPRTRSNGKIEAPPRSPEAMAHGMLEETRRGQPLYLTTKEVAELLRVKERKVYDLAAAGEIPHRRITESCSSRAPKSWPGSRAVVKRFPAERPAVLAGSHDRCSTGRCAESGSGLATLLNGEPRRPRLFRRRPRGARGPARSRGGGMERRDGRRPGACGTPSCSHGRCGPGG